MRALFVAKDRLDAVQIPSSPSPINRRLEDLVPLSAGVEQQVPAVLHLEHRILVLKGAPLLLFQIQSKTVLSTVENCTKIGGQACTSAPV